MARTRDPRKEEPVIKVTPKVPVPEDGVSTGKKRGKPRKNPVIPIPPNNIKTIEPAQPVASTSQLRTQDPRKEESVIRVTRRVPVPEHGASTGGKPIKPRKKPVNHIPSKNIRDAIEPAQPVTLPSQLPITKTSSEKNKRPQKTKDPRKKETVKVAPTSAAPHVPGDGTSTGKKRGKPRKNPVNLIPPNNIKDVIEPAQPVASTSQLSITKTPSEKDKRPLKTKDPVETELWTQQPFILEHVPQPVASTPVFPTHKGSVKGKERMRQEDVDAMMLSTTGNDVMEVDNHEHHPLPFAFMDDGNISQGKGKKRAREDQEPPEEKAPKRIKIAGTSAETVKTVTIKRAKPASTGKAGKRSAVVQSLKWKVVEPAQLDPSVSVEAPRIKETNLRPRIWTNNREELLGMMPEMSSSKWCFNGISWAMYETPMLLLDQVNTCFQVERDDQGSLLLDLITTRSFVCPIPQEPDIQKSSFIEIPPPPQPFEGPASPTGQFSGEKPRPKYKRKYKPPTIKKEMPTTQANLASTSEPLQNRIEAAIPQEALPTFTFNFKKPGLAEPLPEYSSLDNKFKVASGSTMAGAIEPPSSHTMKFESGPVYLYPGVDSTKFIDMVFNIASGAAYPTVHSPPASPGADESLYAGRSNAPATNSIAGYHSMSYHLAQTERTPAQRQPFLSNPILPSPVEGESHMQGSVYSEDMEFSSPPPEGERYSRHGFPSTPEQRIPTSANVRVPIGEYHSVDTGSTSQHVSVMIGEDSDAMRLVDPEEPLESLVTANHDAGHNALASTTLAAEFPMRNGLAQADRLPLPRRPFQSILVIPSPVEGEPYRLGNVYREDTRLSPPPPLAGHGRSSLHGLPPPPEIFTPISSADAKAPVGEGPIDTGSVSQHVSVMIGEDSDAMQLVDPGESQANLVVKSDERLHDYVPSPIPEELGALVDSYLFGRPLTIIISNGLLAKHWSLKLPNEYGYVMLGYFKILGIQEIRVNTKDETKKSTAKAPPQDALSGQVRWKFRLQWAPGGEESILAEGNAYDLKHPWWDPQSSVEETPNESMIEPLVADKAPEEVDDLEASFPTTPRYRDARLRHHEYKFRHFPLDDLYQSVIPLNLLAPFGREYMDTSFPRGWFCKECGRMNFQAALRHRKCLSSFCKDKPPLVASYAQILFLLRDPQERLPLSAPLNQYPEKLTTTAMTQFRDGMQTFSYHLSQNSNVFMKHIFTSNTPPLQEPASVLLNDIQINVPIVRPLTENTPYFFWSAKSPKENTAPTDTEWTNIPRTMNQAKELMVRTVRSFGGLKEEQLAINHLRMLAWITSGRSKRPSDPIQAKNKSIVFLALGCTVGLVVTPKSMGGTTTVDTSQEAESSKLPKIDIVDQDDAASGWIAEDHEDGGEEPIEIPKKGKAIAKSTKPSFVITLMHGDMIVFYGDEFEYSVKRDGTSLLLIASHDSLEHA